MTAQELKERLTEEDIRNLLLMMGATFFYEDDSMWITDTICHKGIKPKLYYYKESKMFHCYTECGQMDIISLVMHCEGFENDEFQKCINWICNKTHISTGEYGFGLSNIQISDWEFIRNYKKNNRKDIKEIVLPEYDEHILNIFQKLYPKIWVDEGISTSTMDKYEISYFTCEHKIIIPHRSVDGKLIGIRCRNTIEEESEIFGKYTPLKIANKFYNHPLGQNLFGLNKNINAIQKKRKIMIVEAEKSVFQTDTMFGEDNFTVALCGSNLTDYQKNLILGLNLREVIIGLDKQYESLDSDECKAWASKIKNNIIDKLSPYLTVSVLWDTDNLIGYKDSPTDKGKDILLKLMENKIYVGTN